MIEPEIWHNYAYLYVYTGLELPEIVKVWFINTLTEVIEDDVSLMGYGFLDNRELYEHLILSMIMAYPEDKVITQQDLADAIRLGRRTISSTIGNLTKDGRLSHRSNSTEYEVLNSDGIQLWIKEFGKALIELHFDEALRERLAAKYQDTSYRRGFQVVWDELRSLRPRRKHKDSSTPS